MSELLEEIRQLRRENYDLRHQVEVSRGLQQHSPYAPLPPDTTSSQVVAPGSTGLGGDVSMGDSVTGMLRPRTPPDVAKVEDASGVSPVKISSPDPKRARSLLEPLDNSVVPPGHAEGAGQDDV